MHSLTWKELSYYCQYSFARKNHIVFKAIDVLLSIFLNVCENFLGRKSHTYTDARFNLNTHGQPHTRVILLSSIPWWLDLNFVVVVVLGLGVGTTSKGIRQPPKVWYYFIYWNYPLSFHWHVIAAWGFVSLYKLIQNRRWYVNWLGIVV